MGNQLLIRKLIEDDLANCEARLADFEAKLPGLPKGSLVRNPSGSLGISVRENGNQYKVTLQEDDKLAVQLREKRYIRGCIPMLKKQIRASKLYLNNSEIYNPAGFAAKLAPQYHELTGLDIFLRGDVNPADWHAGDYEMNSFHSENLIHRTPAGVLMRSKSEVLIGSQLERRGIPYHYEPVIECGDKLYSPDIEILHPRLTRLVYWEHFGMIDDPAYTEKMLKKLKDYGKAGIVPGYNLFYTYETRSHPLTITAINEVIDEILDLQY